MEVGWTFGASYALTDTFVVGTLCRYHDFGKEHPDDFLDRDVKLHSVGVSLSYKF